MKIKTFRHIPEVVQAVRLDDENLQELEAIAEWCGGEVRDVVPWGLEIWLKDSRQVARHDNWIVKRASGRYEVFYNSPQSFDYEEITE